MPVNVAGVDHRRNTKPEVHFNATYPHPGGSLGRRPAHIGLRRVERQQLVERIVVARGRGYVRGRWFLSGGWFVCSEWLWGRWLVRCRYLVIVVGRRCPAGQGRDLHPRRIQ
jgi:hypothetical protein